MNNVKSPLGRNVKWEEMHLLDHRHNWRFAGFCIWNQCGKQGRELAKDGKGMLSMSETLFSASFCPVALKDTQPYPMPL